MDVYRVEHSTGEGFGFNAEQLRHFITSNGFRERLAKALYGLAMGDAVLIKAARQRIVVSRPNGNAPTIKRRFRLKRDLP